jgi:DNA polymerase I-like protein with 3'-5' exonuclease and polymerase domains
MTLKVFLDFEYVESNDRKTQRNVCGTFIKKSNLSQDIQFVDLRTSNQSAIEIFNSIPKDSYVIAYNIVAEIATLMRMGITKEQIRNVKWIDAWIEAKMFMLTHDDYFSKKKSLKEGTVPQFKLNYKYDMNKDPVSTIINNETYTTYQFNEIKKYNIADVEVLIELIDKLKPLWDKYGVKMKEILFRGEFARECAIQYVESNGFPMDVEMLTKVFQNRDEVKYQVGIDCNEATGFPIYRAKVKKRPKELSFNIQAFTDFLKSFGLYQQWAKTEESNKVSTTEDEFEKWMEVDGFLSANKDLLSAIYYARSTIKQLNSTDLLQLLTKDGYIKTPPFPFDQKSGRSSPKPSLGFILNLAPWLRMCIKPKEGKAFISADWSQQEIALAGYFSKDKKLLDSYKGDHYITNAIACGFAPAGATKKSHPNERDMMKAPSLGIIYGMGIKSMAFRVESAMGLVNDQDKLTLDMWTKDDGVFKKYQVQVSRKAYEIAEKFIDGHKDYYTIYWDYVAQHAEDCLEKGYYKTPCNGWYYFTQPDHKPTQLQNIPNQAGGAAVMQLGYIIASTKYNLSIVCSLHDALYVECDINKIDETKEKLLQAMAEAVKIFTGNEVAIRNEVKVFTTENPYYDPRGVRTYNLIKELVK